MRLFAHFLASLLVFALEELRSSYRQSVVELAIGRAFSPMYSSANRLGRLGFGYSFGSLR